MPLAPALAGLVDSGAAFTMLIAVMLYFGMVPGGPIVTLPLFLLMPR